MKIERRETGKEGQREEKEREKRIDEKGGTERDGVIENK